LFMICSNIKLTWPKESIRIGVHDFREQSQWDRKPSQVRVRLDSISIAATCGAGVPSGPDRRASKSSVRFQILPFDEIASSGSLFGFEF
jgi:hypothetical protein